MTLDLRKPYRKLGPYAGSNKLDDLIEQNGVIYGWSESNIQYEVAWWLDPNVKETPLVKHLRETRKPTK